MELTVYGIPNCDTVKRARAWLDGRGLAYRFHDFKKAGVPPERLHAWAGQVGWDKLLNRQGTTWRKLDPTTQAGAGTADGAAALALSQPSLIRRPVVDWPGRTTVGFDAQLWQMLSSQP